VFSWTAVGFHDLPLTKEELRLKPFENNFLLCGLPKVFPILSVQEFALNLKNFQSLSFSTAFTTQHQVYNFPAQLSTKYTSTVPEKVTKIFQSAGKLNSFHNLDVLPHNTASNK